MIRVRVSRQFLQLLDLFYFHRARQFDLAEESLIRGNITRQLYRYVSYF